MGQVVERIRPFQQEGKQEQTFERLLSLSATRSGDSCSWAWEWQLGERPSGVRRVVLWAGLGASGVVVTGTVVTGENLLCRSSDQACLPQSPACLLVTPDVWGQGAHPELLGCSGRAAPVATRPSLSADSLCLPTEYLGLLEYLGSRWLCPRLQPGCRGGRWGGPRWGVPLDFRAGKEAALISLWSEVMTGPQWLP